MIVQRVFGTLGAWVREKPRLAARVSNANRPQRSGLHLFSILILRMAKLFPDFYESTISPNPAKKIVLP